MIRTEQVLSGLAALLSAAAFTLMLVGHGDTGPVVPLHERAPTLLDETLTRLEGEIAALERRLAERATDGDEPAEAGQRSQDLPAPAEVAVLLRRLGELELQLGGLARRRESSQAGEEPLVLDTHDRDQLRRFQAQLGDRELSWRVRYETLETLAAYPVDAGAFAGPVLDEVLAFASELAGTEFLDNVFRQLGRSGLRGDPRLVARLHDWFAKVQDPGVREELVELCAGAQDDPKVRRLLEDLASSSSESDKVRRIARDILEGKRR